MTIKLAEMNSGSHGDQGVEEYDVVVVGAGFGGLYALHRLRSMGLTVRVLEAGSDVGGTWYWNRYPGARCDVESVDYSFSFDEALQQEWHWSERYAPQSEILAYLGHVADRLDLRRDIDFETRLSAARYDQEAYRWHLDTSTGRRLVARYCVMATGNLTATLGHRSRERRSIGARPCTRPVAERGLRLHRVAGRSGRHRIAGSSRFRWSPRAARSSSSSVTANSHARPQRAR